MKINSILFLLSSVAFMGEGICASQYELNTCVPGCISGANTEDGGCEPGCTSGKKNRKTSWDQHGENDYGSPRPSYPYNPKNPPEASMKSPDDGYEDDENGGDNQHFKSDQNPQGINNLQKLRSDQLDIIVNLKPDDLKEIVAERLEKNTQEIAELENQVSLKKKALSELAQFMGESAQEIETITKEPEHTGDAKKQSTVKTKVNKNADKKQQTSAPAAQPVEQTAQPVEKAVKTVDAAITAKKSIFSAFKSKPKAAAAAAG